MLSRILKFRGGDEYEEIKGRDDPGKTTKAGEKSETANANSRDRPTEQSDNAGKPTDASQGTNPNGTSFVVYNTYS